MRVYGIDFTSRPRRRKPITCAACVLDGARLRVRAVSEWQDFAGFEAFLRHPGPWVAGCDFPFGQARRFVEQIRWPRSWAGYVDYVAGLDRAAFRAELDAYRRDRPAGDREHRRLTDVAAGSISPQKLYGTPVGLMFFEGAPRLRAAGVHLPGLADGDPARVVVEAYPGVLARALIGRRVYKQDTRAKQTPDQHRAREEILAALREGAVRGSHGVTVEAPAELADAMTDNPGADRLDALLCAVQAAWAWGRRDRGFGMPGGCDPLEGWIADPAAGRDD